MNTTTLPLSSPPRLPVARATRVAQVILGLIWLIDGVLQFQPYMFGRSFITGVIDPNAVGQPAIIADPITWIAKLIEPHVAVFNGFAATLQVAIGLGLLCRRTVKPALLVSFVWALGIWFTGEGLGMILTGNASPLTGAPGAALLYVFAGLMCWPRAVSDPAGRVWAKRFGLLGERGARGVWGALWLGSAALWLLPANQGSGSVHEAIAAVPSGASWLTSMLDSAARASAGHGTEIAVVMALVSAAVGIGVLRGRHVRPYLALGIAISLVYWVIGQGLGGVFTGQATDVSTAPLVILIAGMLCSLTPRAPRRGGEERAATERGVGREPAGHVRGGGVAGGAGVCARGAAALSAPRPRGGRHRARRTSKGPMILAPPTPPRAPPGTRESSTITHGDAHEPSSPRPSPNGRSTITGSRRR
ncbi:MAG TPA: hypothetical protein VIJ20_13710 [Solirubrobacteraceae bacterium]